MNFKPILFSTAMVQAILAGRKTQTRRIVKSQPAKQGAIETFCKSGPGSVDSSELTEADMEIDALFEKCPYGTIGDVLWVREEHYAYGWWEKNGLTKTGKQKWKFVRSDDPAFGIYFTDTKPEGLRVKPNNYRSHGWYKRLARFMPRKYCRIFLQIADIRVERLQDISEEDAKAEGVLKTNSGDSDIGGTWYKDYGSDASGYGHPEHDFPIVSSAYESFASLWQKINGPEFWEANPWVRAIKFEGIEKPENFLI